jgi:hypothetical protein
VLNENMARCIVACADTLHVAWCDTRNNGSAIYYKRSADQGTTWSPDARLSVTPGFADFPTLAVSGTTVHLAFRDRRTGSYGSYYKRSTDSGRTWEPDVFVSDSTLYNWWPSVAASGPNVYLALNLDTLNSEVYFRRSTDSGTSWGQVQRISDAPLRSEDPCIAASGSDVHIVWNDFRHGGNGHSEVYYRRSSDCGATWGPETRLTSDTAMSYSPTVYPAGESIYVAWEDNRGGNFDIYLKRSPNRGLNWGPDQPLTSDPAASAYPSVISDGANVHLAWFNLGGLGGIYYLCSTDGGASWDSVLGLVPGATTPVTPFVALTRSAVHAIWKDLRDGHGAIYYKRNSLGSVGIEDRGPGTAPPALSSATLVRGVLNLSSSLVPRPAALLDALGRRVLDLRPGHNDVSSLAPGIYFIHSTFDIRHPSFTRVLLVR